MGIVFNDNLETKQYHVCQRCGGTLIQSHEYINCLMCSAPHTGEGKLVPTFSVQEYEALITLYKTMLETS